MGRPVTRDDDREAVRALIHEYCFLLDAGDFDGVAELFADAEVTSSTNPKPRRGAAEVRTMYDAVMLYGDGTPRSLHCISNTTITFSADDTDAASARSYFVVMQRAADVPLQAVLAGEYQDRFARRDGTWCFAARHIVPRLTGDLAQHMRRD
jgi:ketosteroid isomerase-like protein